MTAEEQAYVLSLVQKAISVNTDESEGQQAIDLSAINLCAPDNTQPIEEPMMSQEEIDELLHFKDKGFGGDDIINPYTGTDIFGNEPNGGDDGKGGGVILSEKDLSDLADEILNDDTITNKAIIEFATPCISETSGVEYELAVKPGDSLQENMIIGKVTQNGVWKPIRSVFDSGTILKDENGGFKQLYPSEATRHFIIEDYTKCGEATEFDESFINSFNDRFKKEAAIYQLITDNLCDSLLPWIVQRRYTSYKYGFMGIRIERDSGVVLFNDFLKNVIQPIKDSWLNDVQYMGSEDVIKATGGNVKKINAIGDMILARRKRYVDELKFAYYTLRNNIPLAEYDGNNYYDCRCWASMNNIGGKKSMSTKELEQTLGETTYTNYYMNLIGKVSMLMGDENPHATKYYNLLTDIIRKRMSLECFNTAEIIAEFNWLYQKELGAHKNYNAYENIVRDLGKTPEYNDILMWIQNHTWKNAPATVISQMEIANIYFFIVQNPITSIKYTNLPNTYNPLELAKEEWNKISKFWEDTLKEYEQCQISSVQADFEKMTNYPNQFAEWPCSSFVTIDGTTYEHFLFQNLPEVIESPLDETVGINYDTTAPPIPTSCDVPPNAEELLRNADVAPTADDVQDNEPTTKDFPYWQRYFALATVISLPYLNCGLDIPPFVMMIPLPCIFIAITSVYIKMLDITLVFGISIRGMYIWPIILYVNMSNQYANIMLPLIATLKSIQSKLSAKIESLQVKPLEAITTSFINIVENDSKRLRNENKQLDVNIAMLKTKRTKNSAKIKKSMNRLLKPNMNPRQQIVDPIHAQMKKNKN